jgi:hypothetical protein
VRFDVSAPGLAFSLLLYIPTGAATAESPGPARVFGVLLYVLPAALAGCLRGGATASWAGTVRRA